MSDQPQLFDDPTVRERADIPLNERRPGWKATPAPIGSGPPGETCKTCSHLVRKSMHGKNYRKCLLMKTHWSRGGATDVKAKWDACREWLPANQAERIHKLGPFAVEVLEQCEQKNWTTALFVIADYYEDQGQDMGWLRHTAGKAVQVTIEIRQQWIDLATENWPQLVQIIDKFIGLDQCITCYGNPSKRDVREHLKWINRYREWEKFARYLSMVWEKAPNEKWIHEIPGWGVMCDLLSDELVLHEKARET